MRVQISDSSVRLWLSATDTDNWARKPGAAWPGSQLAGHRLFAEFDRSGLIDFAIDGRSETDCDGNEFNAITSDALAQRLPKDHPCWDVCVGQFNSADVRKSLGNYQRLN